jgi:putative cardiolipin synthase
MQTTLKPMKFAAALMRVLVNLAILASAACTTLNPHPEKVVTHTLPEASTGLLAETVRKLGLEPGQTAAMPLAAARDALEWRLALIDHASNSIDIQYFIWTDDEVGNLLLDRLLGAADRGVRVRILVDDLNMAGADKSIAVFSKHPNLEIRLFNPGRVRKSALGGLGEFLLYFKELNRRMHNKLFIVDNHIAIIGGRNIGNPYFGLSEEYNNVDFDLLLACASKKQISRAFDEYWNSDPTYPGAALSDKDEFDRYESLRSELNKYLQQHGEKLASYPIERRDWSGRFAELPSRMKKARGHFLQDEPVTLDGKELRLGDMIDEVAGEAREEMIFISPYFIPSPDLLESIAQTSSKGIKVKILTGGLDSNNHTSVHSHYRKYRRTILATGAELYEFRHDPSDYVRSLSDVAPITASFISLHLKVLIADRDKLFIGSLNLDPRAMVINTENGIYLESEALGARITDGFELLTSPENAWHVTVNEEDKLQWESSEGVVYSQPARHFGQRISDFFLRLLPIESQL